MQMFKNKTEREVNFGYRFEKPVLFEKLRIFGMPDEWQVRMKDEAEVTNWHNQLSVVSGQWSAAR
jgi:hypothetical protein